MADKKKVYSIVINGLQESVDMVQSLNNQLKDLDKTIKAVEKRTIKIKGEVEMADIPEQKVVVGGSTGSSAEKEKLSDKELAIQKQITAEKKAQAQLDAMQTKEYQKSYAAMSQTKDAIKQSKQELDAMASGAATLTSEGLQYSNTMKGMKAELKALKQERDSLDLAKPEEVERFKEIQQRALELETLLKSIESEAGVFSRNVGNYPQLLKQATTEWENVQKIIVSLTDKLSKATPGTEGYDKLKSELEQAEKYAKSLDDRLGEIKSNLNEVNQTGIKIDVGGKEREFNSLREAVKTLTQELQQMTLAGENNTEEFEATITALGKVKTAMASASGELKSYIGNAKGLSDTVEIMQGFAGIASIGMGLQQLFGGQNEELDETLKKFTAMTLVMQGILNIQQQINDTNSIFGEYLSNVYKYTKDFISAIPLVGTAIDKVSKKTGEWADKVKAVNDLVNNFSPELENTIKKYDKLAKSTDELKDKWEALSASQKFMATQLSTAAFSPSYNLDVIEDDNVKDFLETLRDLKDTNPEAAASFEELSKSVRQASRSMATASFESKGLSKWVKNLAAGTGLASRAFRGLVVSAKAATAAIKGLLASTVILLAVQALLEGLLWVVEKLGDAFQSMKGPDALDPDGQMEMLAKNTELANKQLEKYINTMNLAKNLGLLSELQAQGLAFKEIDKYIQKAGKDLQEFIRIQDDLKVSPIDQNFNSSHIWGDDADIKNMEEFEKEWNTLIKAVETGQDKIEAGSKKGWGWLLTSGDAVEELGDKTKAVLGDMMNEINKIDFSKPEKAVKQFREITDKELYQSALTQMHTLFPEEEWAKSLDRMYNNLSDFVDKSEKRAEDLAVAMKKANDELADAAELSNINAIPDANKRQEALDEYNKKKRKKEIQDTVADEEHKKKALEALDKEYAQKAKDRAKARAKSMQSAGDAEYAILKQIRDNLFTLEKEGLDKQIKQLENAMADELRATKNAGKHRGELILSIQKKYQKLIEDKRVEWYKNQKKQIEQWNKELIQMAQETANELAEIQNAGNLNAINRGLEENENQNIKRTTTISYETNVDTSKMSFGDNDQLLEKQKKYYDELLKAQSEYIAKKTQLQLEESLENERQLKEQAEREYNQRLASNKEWQEAQLEELNKFYKDGLIKEEEYNEKLLQLTYTYENSNTDAYETYQQKLNEATKNGEQERNNIISEGRQEQQRTNDEANQKAISAIQDYYNEITDISEREQKKNMNRHTGLFNYAAEKERLEKVKAGYEKVMADLEADYEKLKEQYNAGDIDFDQFQAGKKQIEDLKKQAKKAAEDTSESLSDLFQNYAQSINDFASKIASQFQDMFSAFQNIQSLMLDAEQNQLDEEEKMLDKEKDAVEKAYEKQADIVQRYKDAINGTEDELKNARGERRLALLDSLAQQKEGYAAETEALKKQELEKEKIAKKEEQLKKKQDALEKKRKKQQQVASVINATINTALGVTQALASWPPPASYALAAAVGALGAVEIALIASQKYAKGGLIEGPDHAHGGVKVQTKKGIAEVEGNEYIVNKKTTTENLSLIEFVNSKKRRLNLNDFIEFYSGKAKGHKPGSSLKFAEGGTMPELTDYSQMVQNQPVQVELSLDSKVSVVDIINSMDRVTQTKVLAGL